MHSFRNVRWMCCAMRSSGPLRQGRPGFKEGRILWPLRYYAEEVGPQRRQRKSKEERRVLIVSFVEQYMVSHEGEFPELRTVYKEVGGAYTTVKEIFQDLVKNRTVDAIQNEGIMGTSEKNELLDDGTVKNVLASTDTMDSSDQNRMATDATLNVSEKNEYREISGSEAGGSYTLKQSAVETCDVEIMVEMKDMQRSESLHRSDSDSGVFIGKTKKTEGGQVSDEHDSSQDLNLQDKVPREGLLQSCELPTKPQYAMSSNGETEDTVQFFPAEDEQTPEMQQRVAAGARLSKVDGVLQTTTQDVMTSENEAEDDPDFAAPEYTQTADGLAKAQMKDTFMIQNIEVMVDQEVTKDSLGTADASPTSNTIKGTGDRSYNTADKVHKREELGHHSLSDKLRIAEPVHATNLSSRSSTEVGKAMLPPKSSSMSMEACNDVHSLKKEWPFGVLLKNVPAQVNISEVRAAMSLYGEVNVIHRRSGSGSTTGYIVEFKTNAAQLLLLANSWIVLRNHPYQVTNAGNPMTTIVRLCNVPSDITAYTVRSICEAEGPVIKVEQRKGDIVDVHFGSKVLPYMRKLLARLNTVTIKDVTLCASPAQRFPCDKHQPALAHPDHHQVLKLWQGGLLDEIDACAKQMRVDLQDLNSLMNLKIRSMAGQSGKAN